jgi:hypothetical protein
MITLKDHELAAFAADRRVGASFETDMLDYRRGIYSVVRLLPGGAEVQRLAWCAESETSAVGPVSRRAVGGVVLAVECSAMLLEQAAEAAAEVGVSLQPMTALGAGRYVTSRPKPLALLVADEPRADVRAVVVASGARVIVANESDESAHLAVMMRSAMDRRHLRAG